MAKKSDDDFRKNIEVHYRQLMKQCKVHMEEQDKALPPARVDLKEELSDRGVTRRDFLKWTSCHDGGPDAAAHLQAPGGKGRREVQPAAGRLAPLRRVHGLQRVAPEDVLSECGRHPPGHDLARVPRDAHGRRRRPGREVPGKGPGRLSRQVRLRHRRGDPAGPERPVLRLGPQGQRRPRDRQRGDLQGCGNDLHRRPAPLGQYPGRPAQPHRREGRRRGPGHLHGQYRRLPAESRSTSSGTAPALPHVRRLCRPSMRRAGLSGPTGSASTTSASGAPTTTPASSWRSGATRAPKGLVPLQDGLQGTLHLRNCAKVRFNDGMSWPVMAGHGCIGCTEIGFWDHHGAPGEADPGRPRSVAGRRPSTTSASC